jgi:hypothetical protein
MPVPVSLTNKQYDMLHTAAKPKTTASRQVAFLGPQFWFTEPECRSVRGQLGRKQTQEDLNVTPTYLTHTCNVTSKRGSWIEFKDLSLHLLYEQTTKTHKVRLLGPILTVTEIHNGNYTCHSQTLHFLNSSALFYGSQATPDRPRGLHVDEYEYGALMA